MDRNIPQSEIRRRKIKKVLKYFSVFAVILVLIWAVMLLLAARVDRDSIVMSVADRGAIDVSNGASGVVKPVMEEIINSPINSRIVSVLCHEGDSVDEGTPLLELDLQGIETEYRNLLDEKQMQLYRLEQAKVAASTAASNLEMQIKVAEMKVERMEAELRNEIYLDSIGSGTTDKVRQADFACKTGRLELKQLRQQYANDRKVSDADLKVRQLEYNIFLKQLAEKKRVLDDARIRSPRKAVLTYINNQKGAQIAAGTQVAVVSDLTHFKVEGEISDTYLAQVAVGHRALVRIGRVQLMGRVANVSPQSKNRTVAFSVQLDDDGNKVLRPGLKVDVYVINSIKDNVLRIANGAYYKGRGDYYMFVKTGEDMLVKRKVILGDSSFDHVEVLDGLQEGEEVVISDMGHYNKENRIKIK